MELKKLRKKYHPKEIIKPMKINMDEAPLCLKIKQAILNHQKIKILKKENDLWALGIEQYIKDDYGLEVVSYDILYQGNREEVFEIIDMLKRIKFEVKYTDETMNRFSAVDY